MALTSSTETCGELDAAGRATLLQIARATIGDGLDGARPRALDLEQYAGALRAPAATFVTLELYGELRGCIGTLEAFQPLALDTAENAYAAAYRDPRFPALRAAEFERLDIHISVLSAPQPLAFTSEQDLIRQLRPGIDGLILREQGRCGTFLPAVWDAAADPWEFLRSLKVKTGLPPDYWSDTLTVSRYTTLLIGERVA